MRKLSVHLLFSANFINTEKNKPTTCENIMPFGNKCAGTYFPDSFQYPATLTEKGN